jgi:hypothetical protein
MHTMSTWFWYKTRYDKQWPLHGSSGMGVVDLTDLGMGASKKRLDRLDPRQIKLHWRIFSGPVQ